MKKVNLLFLLLIISSISAFTQSTHIHVDQFGYQKNAQKVAVLVDPQVGFNASASYSPSATLQVRNVTTNAVVFSGTPIVWNNGQTDVISGDRGWRFDFSSVTTNGTYYVFDPVNNMSSPSFEIEEEPYREVLRAASKMFYYNRCGFVKSGAAAGNWTDGMSFNNPLQDANCRLISDPNNASLEKNLTGGWFDAGDYNKYVTFAYSTVHNLLTAYQNNPSLFTDNWNWPESGNGIPDILDEVKWEIDWLLKMTNADGSVHIKMGSQNYGENTDSPPSVNTDQRFYGPTCSSASIAAASMLAHAAVVFSDYPSLQTYTNQILARAQACYTKGVSYFNNNNFELNCDDGSIVSGDTDWDVNDQVRGLLSASIYLYKATSTASYQTFIINNGYLVSPLLDNYWSGYELTICDAFLYYSTIVGANTGMQGSIISSATTAVANNWSGYFGMPDAGLYRDSMPNWSYHWGSNSIKCNYGILNATLANKGIGSATNLKRKAEGMIHSMHGVNPLGLVYLTNMTSFGAEKSVNQIYHNWFADGTIYDHALTSPKGPPPGYVPGGPNPYFSVQTLTPPYGQPPAKSYLDFNDLWPNNSWEVSEASITYQAAYVRLLTEIIGTEFANLELKELEENQVLVYPNPATESIYFESLEEIDLLEIFDISGKRIQTFQKEEWKNGLNITGFQKGMYLVRISTIKGQVTNRFEKL